MLIDTKSSALLPLRPSDQAGCVRRAFPMAFLMLAMLAAGTASAEDMPRDITLSVNIGTSEEVLVESEGKYVAADSSKAVVLVHQSGGIMNDWAFLASLPQQNQIASLATNESRPGDVVAAYHYLAGQGYTELFLLGASASGGAVLQAMAQPGAPKPSKVIFLATAGGTEFTNTEVEKLFIVGSGDFFASAAKAAFSQAAEPKTLFTVPTHHHAQALFESSFKDEVAAAIVSFLAASD